jgi:hypothetical protein
LYVTAPTTGTVDRKVERDLRVHFRAMILRRFAPVQQFHTIPLWSLNLLKLGAGSTALFAC